MGRLWRWRRRLGGLGILFALLGTIHQVRQSDLFYPLAEPYDRALYRHWIDANGDCRDTRTEVLIRDSLRPVTLSGDGCSVVKGEWRDPYTGKTLTDPSGIDIDHMIPLAEAHRSGADLWTSERRERFANDLDTPGALVAVEASVNRSKADRDVLSWMPPNPLLWCDYLATWRRVKAVNHLQPDLLEGWTLDLGDWVCSQRPAPALR